MSVVVFLGPSLGQADARRILPDAIFLPPARQADVVSAVTAYAPRVIGLIDGAFGQSPAVWHKELLYALHHGVRVFGAASMGALRAVELATYGMQGVGEVYRLFSSGELQDDDEVALLHGPAEDCYPGLSEPMVNLRATFRRARDMRVVSSSQCDVLIDIAKRLHFARRTLPAVLDLARSIMPSDVVDGLRAFAVEGYVDVKQADARLLLETIRDLPTFSPPPDSLVEPFVRSAAFERLYNEDRTVQHAGAAVSLRAIAARAALHLADFDELNFAALNRALVQVLADQLGIRPTDADVDVERQRFCHERALGDEVDLERWLRAHDLDPVELRTLMTERATCRRLHHLLLAGPLAAQHTRWVLDELRLRGVYDSVADDAALQSAIVQEWNLRDESLANLDDRSLIRLVADHASATGWRPRQPLDDWAMESGFDGVQDLAYELLWAVRARDRAALKSRME